MKTAVSIPDEVFEQAERVAKRQKKSRSELYADALAEYLAKREPAEVTAAINAALEKLPSVERDAFLTTAARRAVCSAEW